MPAMMVWPVSVSVRTRKVGSSSASLASAVAELVLLGLGLGLDRDVDDRIREDHRLEQHRGVVGAQRVAGGGVLQADGGDDVAGRDDVDVLAVVGVHLQQATDALLVALRRVQDVGAGAQACPSRRGSR